MTRTGAGTNSVPVFDKETSYEKSWGVADRNFIFLPSEKKGKLNKPQRVIFILRQKKKRIVGSGAVPQTIDPVKDIRLRRATRP